MKRRDFIGKAGCAGVAMAAAGTASGRDAAAQVPAPKFAKYRIEIDIFEARPDSWCHKKGDRFAYPADWGKLCPWLRGTLNEFVRMLENGVTLPWKYEGTAYEKVIDPEGVTTEYIRCPDPTSNLVARITRTRV